MLTTKQSFQRPQEFLLFCQATKGYSWLHSCNTQRTFKPSVTALSKHYQFIVQNNSRENVAHINFVSYVFKRNISKPVTLRCITTIRPNLHKQIHWSQPSSLPWNGYERFDFTPEPIPACRSKKKKKTLTRHMQDCKIGLHNVIPHILLLE